MISKDKFPQDRNFTVDEIEASGLERKEIVATLKRMEDEGLGRFITGRRGAKSRWEWKGKESAVNTLQLIQGEAAKVQQISPGGSLGGLRLREGPIAPLPSVVPPPLALKEEKEEEKEEERPKPKKGERDPFLVIRDQREGVSSEPQISVNEMLQTLSAITGYKGAVSFEALKEFVDKQHKELLKHREGATWDEPPGIEHVPYEWISEQDVGDGKKQIGWGFWSAEQREAIAKELRTYRKGK